MHTFDPYSEGLFSQSGKAILEKGLQKACTALVDCLVEIAKKYTKEESQIPEWLADHLHITPEEARNLQASSLNRLEGYVQLLLGNPDSKIRSFIRYVFANSYSHPYRSEILNSLDYQYDGIKGGLYGVLVLPVYKIIGDEKYTVYAHRFGVTEEMARIRFYEIEGLNFTIEKVWNSAVSLIGDPDIPSIKDEPGLLPGDNKGDILKECNRVKSGLVYEIIRASFLFARNEGEVYEWLITEMNFSEENARAIMNDDFAYKRFSFEQLLSYWNEARQLVEKSNDEELRRIRLRKLYDSN